MPLHPDLEVGSVYDLDGLLFVVVRLLWDEAYGAGVRALVLEDRLPPGARAQKLAPGTTFALLRASSYWGLCERIASLSEQGTVGP